MREYVMTAAVTSDFDAVLFGKADQCVDLPVAWVVPHLCNLLIGSAHELNDTKCNIIRQIQIRISEAIVDPIFRTIVYDSNLP